MSSRSRSAFVAVRMAPGLVTAEPQAIVVGTMPAGVAGWTEGDWRYACHSLRGLLDLLESGGDPLVNVGAATFASAADAVEATQHSNDKEWKSGRLHATERDALEELG